MTKVAVAAGLLVLAGACTQTLDAGHSGPPEVPTGLLDGLIGHWRLDDGAGSQTAFDSSGRGNEGTLRTLDAATAWVTGRSAGALAVEHAGWVQVPRSASIDAITTVVTVSAWVYPAATNTPEIWGTALSRQVGTTDGQHYHISLFERRPSWFVISSDDYVHIVARDEAPQDAWTHLAGTYDGAVARLYVDGVEVANQVLTGGLDADTTPVILGGNNNDGSGVPTELFPGRIDELMLYARALSATEIAQLSAGALFPAAYRDAGTD